MTDTAAPTKRSHRGGKSARRRRARAKAMAGIAILTERWPEAFRIVGQRQPLKVGIFGDIIAATVGAIKSSEVHAALAHYTGHILYLRALKEGAARVDLQGTPAGTVTADAAAHAQERLKRIEALRKERQRAQRAASAGHAGAAETSPS